jgi:hypothetical protein
MRLALGPARAGVPGSGVTLCSATIRSTAPVGEGAGGAPRLVPPLRTCLACRSGASSAFASLRLVIREEGP